MNAKRDVDETTCAIVGAGPAGAVLALLLARRGIPVTLLEMHRDFECDFRGDTLHPSTLEIMDELGLAERLLQLPHTEMNQMTTPAARGPVVVADFTRLKTKFPFVAMMPQARFLEFVTAEAARCPGFRHGVILLPRAAADAEEPAELSGFDSMEITRHKRLPGLIDGHSGASKDCTMA